MKIRDNIRRPLVPIAILAVLLSLLYVRGISPGLFMAARERLISDLSGGVAGNVLSVTSKDDGCVLQVNTDHGKIMVLAGAEYLSLRPGNMIEICGTEYAFRAASNPGQFDEKKYYEGEGIVLRVNAKKIVVTDSRYSVFKEALRLLRENMGRSIEASFDSEKAGVLKAMLLGDKTAISADVKDLYRKNGIAHILAISGLHISIFGNAIFMLLRKLRMNVKVAGGISAALLLSYGVLTGFSVSTSRAVIMTLLSILALCIGRTYDMISGIAASCIIVLVLNPGEVGQAGFLLSFSAATGVAVFNEYFDVKNRVIRPFVFSAFLSLVTLPVIMCSYYEVSVMGVLLNLVVIPSMSLLVPVGLTGALVGAGASVGVAGGAACVAGAAGASAGVAGGLAGFGGGVSLFLFGSVNYLMEFYDLLCRLAEKVPFASVITGKPSGWRIVIYYLLLFAPVWVSGLRERLTEVSKDDAYRKKIKGYAPAFMALGLLILISRAHEFKVTMLDVGQGDAIVIENDNGNTYIVDCGSTSIKNVGQYRLIPFLKYEGVSKVSAMFYTHLDKDHVSGGDELLGSKDIRTERLYLSEKFEGEYQGDYLSEKFEGEYQEDSTVSPIGAEKPRTGEEEVGFISRLAGLFKEDPGPESPSGEVFRTGTVLCDGKLTLTCLYSGEGAADANDGSLVLLLQHGDFSMILTGDISSSVEKKLLSLYPEGCDVDVLKVAHHGSKYSTSADFLSWCTPERAGISAGVKNRYGHPHEEVLTRLAAAGVTTRRTDEEGALTFRGGG